MQMNRDTGADRAPTRLQDDLIESILDIVRRDRAAPGDRLNEKQLAARLNVSRSPVRAALDVLERRGLVARRPQIGVVLVAAPPNHAHAPVRATDEDELLVRIARDRDQGQLPEDFSTVELAQRYGLPRSTLKAALERLADLDMVRRKPGYGWRFMTDWNATVYDESYRFRMVIEPAAILEPAFRLPPGWADAMRRRHAAVL